MMDPIRRFELAIIRPLHLILIASGISFIFRGMWFWLLISIISAFYVGIIGSKLHPLQSTKDLMQGALENPIAEIEHSVLPASEKQRLVGQACTRVGILVAFLFCVITISILNWYWYLVIPFAYFIVVVSSGLLKFIFKST